MTRHNVTYRRSCTGPQRTQTQTHLNHHRIIVFVSSTITRAGRRRKYSLLSSSSRCRAQFNRDDDYYFCEVAPQRCLSIYISKIVHAFFSTNTHTERDARISRKFALAADCHRGCHTAGIYALQRDTSTHSRPVTR